MSFYQTINFNKEKFQQELLLKLDKCMDEAIKTVFGSHPYFSGTSDKNSVFNGVEYDIHSTDFKAWILEYGKGKYLDEGNPYLADYKNSLYWNDKRNSHNNAILYRGQGKEYTQLDYESGSGSYTAEGRGHENLELPDWAQGVKPSPFIDDLFDKVWILFGTDSIAVIRDMENHLNDYFDVSSPITVR